MSKSRSRRYKSVRPENGYSYELSERGYIRIVARGCGGTRDYWGEYDCTHRYPWTCGECPIVLERYKDEPEEEPQYVQFT